VVVWLQGVQEHAFVFLREATGAWCVTIQVDPGDLGVELLIIMTGNNYII
jgi:hypothetical protein